MTPILEAIAIVFFLTLIAAAGGPVDLEAEFDRSATELKPAQPAAKQKIKKDEPKDVSGLQSLGTELSNPKEHTE